MDMSDSEIETLPESPEITVAQPTSNQKVFTEEEKWGIVDRDQFYRKLTEYYEDKRNKKPFTRDGLNSLLEEIHIAKAKRFRKDRREYFLLKTYDTAEVDGREQVIRKNDKLLVIPFEDLYDIIFDFHMKTNHAGKNKMERAYKIGEANIPRPVTEVFLLCCNICFAKRHALEKAPSQKPKYVKGFAHKGQVDVVDFKSTPDGRYSMVLAYQDHHTKFMILRPLQNDLPEIIAQELSNIFMMFGIPKVLESHNGKYFVNKIINSIDNLWSETIIGHGEPKLSDIPCKSPEEIEKLIRKWMNVNHSAKWVTGLNIVQWQVNTTSIQSLGRCPYQAVFGFSPQINLRSTTSINGEIAHGSSSSVDIVKNSYFEEDRKSRLGIVHENLTQEISSGMFLTKDSSLFCKNCHKTVTGDCLLCEICAECIHSSCQKEIIWDDSLKRDRNICNNCFSCDSENPALKRMKKETEELLVE
ncbi:hypothetical protein WA026_002011 [Henosepilachna vigintioctopunctata]|uniref:Integrase catalytic domain-containing protein n=1 Tax=Henosepilachna vigintioctopunctata TaxID=420089 RepID=A0AAW1URX2_9CUCU